MKTVVSTVAPQRFEKYRVSFPEGWDVHFIHRPYTDAELTEVCKQADYLLVDSVDPVSADVIASCPKLKLIHTEGVGFDKVDAAAAKAVGIPVCNNRAVNNGAVAEHTIGLMLAAMRRTALCTAQIRSEGYAACQRTFRATGEHEIAGKQIGLIGIGAIGREVAKRLSAWGCEICYYDAFRPNEETEQALGVRYLPLDELIATSDVISVHVPVLESTYHMLSRAQFAAMKSGAVVINTARGEIIDSEALAEALENGSIAAAALDTVEPEPMPDTHPLAKLSEQAAARLTFTPHVGGTTDEAFTRMLQWAIANFVRVENGEKPVNCVNGLGA